MSGNDKQLWVNEHQKHMAKIKQAQIENGVELEVLLPFVLGKVIMGDVV